MSTQIKATIPMTPIKIQITGKPWLSKVTGLSEKYGVFTEFLKPSEGKSARLNYYEIAEPGIYKHEPREAVCLSMRRDTGFLRVTEAGEVTEITPEEAKEAAKEMDVATSAAKNYQAENNPLAKYSDVELLAEIQRRGLR